MKPTLKELREKFIGLGHPEMFKLADPKALEAWLNELGWTSVELMAEGNRERDAHIAERNAEFAALSIKK